MTRTAFSPYIYEYKDYAVGFVGSAGELLAQSTGGMPVFVADSVGMAVKDGLEVYGRENLHKGDVIVCNHAAVQGQHLNNTVMYTPVFAEPNRDELIGFFSINCHWIDIGGGAIGSVSYSSTDIFMEGLQLRSIKLWSKGEPIEEVYRIIENNTRFPVELLGDIAAQHAGCVLGRDLTQALADKYGESEAGAASLRYFATPLPGGGFFAFNLLLAMLVMPLRMLGMWIGQAQRATAAGERIFELLDEPEEVETISRSAGTTDVQSVEGGFNWRRLDSLSEPTRGFSGSLRLELAGQALGGDVDFVRAQATGEWFVPVAEDAEGRQAVLDYYDAAYEDMRADPEIQSWYVRFETVNDRFLQLVSAWQNNGEGQDRVYDRLARTVERHVAALEQVADRLPRYRHYAERFRKSLDRVDSGQVEYVTSPTVDSLHNIWFEFHEDILAVIGRPRETVEG